jgi:hypothetical protein
MPNLLTFQLVMGDEQFYCMGVYIPPNYTMGVEDLQLAWEACPDGCIPIILGDLNINFGDPWDEREELIVDLLDEINLVDTSRKYAPWRPRRLLKRARWTWQHKREGRTHYSQPDYILAREGDVRRFRKVGFRWPRYHDSNHRAVVATIQQGRKGRLKSYRKQRQQLPLQLPTGPHNELTMAFKKMKAECIEPAAKYRNCKDWVSNATWQLIKQRTSLHQAGQLCRNKARKMQREIEKALHVDRDARTKSVGKTITHKLAGGNVQEAFRHLNRVVLVCDRHPSAPVFPDHGPADRGADRPLPEARSPTSPDPRWQESIRRLGRNAYQRRDLNHRVGTFQRA